MAPRQRTVRIILQFFVPAFCLQLVRIALWHPARASRVIAPRQRIVRSFWQLFVPAFVVTEVLRCLPCASPPARPSFVIAPRQRTVHTWSQLRLSAFVVTKKLAARFASSSCILRHRTQPVGWAPRLAPRECLQFSCQDAGIALQISIRAPSLAQPSSWPSSSSFTSGAYPHAVFRCANSSSGPRASSCS